MAAYKHGLSKSPEGRKIYSAWTDAKRRCYDTDCKHYIDYGGRGIVMHAEWKEDVTLFYKAVVSLPSFGLDRSLERIDNDGGYIPGNVRWATKAEQVQNRRKLKNNTSGFSGVTWYHNATGGTRAIAWYEMESGSRKSSSKSFPEKRFGLLPAFAMAVEYRRNTILYLNSQGANYSAKHGK